MTVLRAAEMPTPVYEVAQRVAEFIGATVDDLVVADHEHEKLEEGAFTLTYEGDQDWPFRFGEAVAAGEVSLPTGWSAQAGTGWYLVAFPDDDQPRLRGLTFAEWAKEAFEYENCGECGGGASVHVGYNVLGNWFARCVARVAFTASVVESDGTEHSGWVDIDGDPTVVHDSQDDGVTVVPARLYPVDGDVSPGVWLAQTIRETLGQVEGDDNGCGTWYAAGSVKVNGCEVVLAAHAKGFDDRELDRAVELLR